MYNVACNFYNYYSFGQAETQGFILSNFGKLNYFGPTLNTRLKKKKNFK